ncbi:MAG: FAD-linked oxidase C-terminal domain-containing protein [Candidatus Dormibacteria bacterium]|jgi:D-lactate dehydrogenase
MLSTGARQDLERQVGAAHIHTRPADLAAYAFDAFGASGERRLPDAVVLPATTEEVSGVVRVCARHGLPIVPRGAGTGYAAGAVARHGGVILNLCRMSRILGLDPEGQSLHAEAGVVTAAVQRRAATAGLHYPPDPGSASTSTIGGNVACNAAGPHAFRYGTTADFLVGATVVLGDGETVRLGAVDGSASAPPLLGLLAGSEGTLAVITEVVLRLLPAPAARATLAARFAGLEAAFGAVAEIARQGLVPAALEFLDRSAVDAVARTGIVKVRAGAALVLVELEGDEAAVRAEVEAAGSALSSAGAVNLEQAAGPADATRLWEVRRAVSAAVATVMVGKINEDVVVPRDRVAELVARTEAIGGRHRVPVVNFGHLGDGNLHVTFLIDPRRPGERARGDAAAVDLFETVLGMDGSLSGEHGVGTTKLAYAERQLGHAGMSLMRRVKRRYDPGGLLNPGIKLPEPVAPAPSGA